MAILDVANIDTANLDMKKQTLQTFMWQTNVWKPNITNLDAEKIHRAKFYVTNKCERNIYVVLYVQYTDVTNVWGK